MGLLHLLEGLRLSAPLESLLPTNFPPSGLIRAYN